MIKTPIWLKITAVFVIASLCATPVLAKKPSKGALKQRLSTVNKQINVVQKQIRVKKQQAHKAKVELAATEQKLMSTQDRLTNNKIRLAQSQRKLKVISERLVRNQRQLDRRARLLSGRLADIYKGDDIGYIDVLLGAQDMNTFLSRGHYVKKIVSSDVDLIKEIKRKRLEIEQDKKSQAAAVRQITVLQASLIQERDSVADLADQREGELRDIEHDRALYEHALAGLMAKSQEIEDTIRRYQSTPRGIKRFHQRFAGGLSLPANGRFTSRFGYRIHPVTGVRSLHTGLDIACPTGTAIHAAANGEVILSGWMGAYGNAVVIDHGGGVQTLYGHNSRLIVRAGQQVRRGQVIASAGSTGWSTGPHCHFEKRVNGRPVNPL